MSACYRLKTTSSMHARYSRTQSLQVSFAIFCDLAKGMFFLTLGCNPQFEVSTYTLLFAADYFYGLFFTKFASRLFMFMEGQSIKACRLHTINKEMGIYWNLVFWSAGES